MNDFFNFSIDLKNWIVQLNLSLWVVLPIIIGCLSFLLWKYFKNKTNSPYEIAEMEIAYKIGQQEIKYKVVRNFINLEVAHRIYIELITRKAAIEIDDKHDVIEEIYNSWYNLFQITRDEIKKFSGSLLENNQHSDDLIQIATDVLNKGLRPHLTEHQARFRRWYAEELTKEGNKSKSPQDIQCKYPDYKNLTKSMKEVNMILMNYAAQLRKFIKGDSPSV